MADKNKKWCLDAASWLTDNPRCTCIVVGTVEQVGYEDCPSCSAPIEVWLGAALAELEAKEAEIKATEKNHLEEIKDHHRVRVVLRAELEAKEVELAAAKEKIEDLEIELSNQSDEIDQMTEWGE